MTTFADLGLGPAALAAITAKGFEEPTPVQAQAIPPLLQQERDLIVQAQTGTGKTATFGLVFTEKLTAKKSKNPQAIVLAPTRELAVQISEELNSLKGQTGLRIVPIYGGQSWTMQRRHLAQGVDIVVGTPGRVIDHLQRRTLDLGGVDYFVLDEADEMLNMGFIEDIESILDHVNPERQTLLFSATMPRRIEQLASRYMQEAETIRVSAGQIANNTVDQIYFEVYERDKFEALCRIIDMEEDFYGIIFCRTRVATSEVSKHLNDRGYRTEALHGDVAQDGRTRILKNFKARRTEILVATDVAARGIDVQNLTHVINYALPQNAESYVHRIGRTGRAGREGKAITLITPAESRKLRSYQHHAKAEISRQDIPPVQELLTAKKAKFISRITDLAQTDLTTHDDLATTLLAAAPAEQVVRALLSYAVDQQFDPTAYKEIKPVKPRPERGEKGSGRLDLGESRLFLTLGRQHGATPPRILEMLAADFNVPKRQVGDIDIMDEYSFISVPLPIAESILDAFHQMQQEFDLNLRIERAEPKKRTRGRGTWRRRKGGGRGRSGGGSRGRGRR